MRDVIAFAGMALLTVTMPLGTSAAEDVLRTDANLVTSLDISDSIKQRDERIEFEGLASAIAQPALLRVIRSGRHGRIGFTVHTWSSHGAFETIVPWTVIASSDDANRVAQLLRSVPRPEPPSDEDEDDPEQESTISGHLTDVSRSIDFAHALAATAPYLTERSIINICGNGEDNVGVGPDGARDRVLGQGLSINALVIGDRDGLAEYFREHVIGGIGAFVLEADDFQSVAEAMATKFVMDLIASRDAPDDAVIVAALDGRRAGP